MRNRPGHVPRINCQHTWILPNLIAAYRLSFFFHEKERMPAARISMRQITEVLPSNTKPSSVTKRNARACGLSKGVVPAKYVSLAQVQGVNHGHCRKDLERGSLYALLFFPPRRTVTHPRLPFTHSLPIPIYFPTFIKSSRPKGVPPLQLPLGRVRTNATATRRIATASTANPTTALAWPAARSIDRSTGLARRSLSITGGPTVPVLEPSMTCEVRRPRSLWAVLGASSYTYRTRLPGARPSRLDRLHQRCSGLWRATGTAGSDKKTSRRR